MKVKEELVKRKQEMERLSAEGQVFEEYQPYLNEAKVDADLALHYLIRDTVIAFKSARKRKNLTQADLAKKMGTKQTAVSRFESMSGTPSIPFLVKYASALGENLHTILSSALHLQLPVGLTQKAMSIFDGDPDQVRQGLIKELSHLIEERYERNVKQISCAPPRVIKMPKTRLG